jgi:hypothetical protein
VAHRREIRGGAARFLPVAGEAGSARGAYQAWSTPQCGQPTDVVTAALKM